MKQINQTEFEQIRNSEELMVVDFFATWCGPCKMLAPVLDELSNEINDVKFVKIDTDENMDLAMEFNITTIPTLVFMKNGIEIDRKVGFIPKNSLKEDILNKK